MDTLRPLRRVTWEAMGAMTSPAMKRELVKRDRVLLQGQAGGVEGRRGGNGEMGGVQSEGELVQMDMILLQARVCGGEKQGVCGTRG